MTSARFGISPSKLTGGSLKGHIQAELIFALLHAHV